MKAHYKVRLLFKLIMSERYKNKYRIESSRLQGFDYSQNGMYFVTICTKDREHLFGCVENGRMVLNEIGEIVKEEILQTPIIRENIRLDEWVIMPNHLHIILEILYKIGTPVETPRRGVSTVARGVSTLGKRGGFNPAWKPNSLGSIINQIKSVCTKRIRKTIQPHHLRLAISFFRPHHPRWKRIESYPRIYPK